MIDDHILPVAKMPTIVFPSADIADEILSIIGEPVLDFQGNETGARTVDGVQVYPVDRAEDNGGRVAISHPFSNFPTTPEGKESAITIITTAIENYSPPILSGKLIPAKMGLDAKGVEINTATTPMIAERLPEDWVYLVKENV